MQAGDGSDGRGAGGASSAAEPDVAARYTRGGAILRAMEQQGATGAVNHWRLHIPTH